MQKTGEFDAYAGAYEEMLRKNHQTSEKEEEYYARYKIEIIRRFVKKGLPAILDYGCGVGKSTKYLLEHFPDSKVCGCDLSEESLKIASDKNPTAVFRHNSCFSQTKFDMVFIANVFHHVPAEDRPIVTKEVRSLVRDHGQVFIFEHNPNNPITLQMVGTCGFDKEAKLLRPGELIRLFKKEGFQLKRKSYTLFFPKWMGFLRPLEKYLVKIPLGAQYYLEFQLS